MSRIGNLKSGIQCIAAHSRRQCAGFRVQIKIRVMGISHPGIPNPSINGHAGQFALTFSTETRPQSGLSSSNTTWGQILPLACPGRRLHG
jgi:hypothetical protein